MSPDVTTAERLRGQFSAAAEADAAVEALLVEACRIADRLDRIHEFESGKGNWYEVFKFRMGDDHETVHVSINGVLSEARQQANTLRSLVATLMSVRPVSSVVLKVADNPLDEVKLRRERRHVG